MRNSAYSLPRRAWELQLHSALALPLPLTRCLRHINDPAQLLITPTPVLAAGVQSGITLLRWPILTAGPTPPWLDCQNRPPHTVHLAVAPAVPVHDCAPLNKFGRHLSTIIQEDWMIARHVYR
jgi:hypothetical protein